MEEMRRVFIFLVFFFLFFMATRNQAYAQCKLSADQLMSPLPSDFNDEITIKSSSDCFQIGTKYIIVAYPEQIESHPDRYSNYPVDRKNPTDMRTITGRLNLSHGAIGRGNVGQWIMKVCFASDLAQCGGSNNVLGKVPFTVLAPTPTPTPTPSQDLPIIDLASQTRCTFQVGEEVVINKITNLRPNTTYSWWWHGDGGRSGTINPGNETSASLTIEGWRTDKAGDRVVCVDIEGSRRCLAQNSIVLRFTAGPPTEEEKMPCIALSPTPIRGTPSPPPCAKPEFASPGGEWKKCLEVETGIGKISTDPGGLVSFLLKFILYLSGGITLLLIIYGGYRLMTSQGNPEKLQEAKETITSAIVGLLFIIFSLVLLEIIGVDILRIPGFAK